MGRTLGDGNRYLTPEDQAFVLRVRLEFRPGKAPCHELRFRVEHVNSGKVWLESQIDTAFSHISKTLKHELYPTSN